MTSANVSVSVLRWVGVDGVDRPVEQRAGRLGLAGAHGERRELGPGTRLEPVVAVPGAELVDPLEVWTCAVGASEGHLEHADGQLGEGDERFVAPAEAVQRVGCGLQCAVEVVTDRQRPGDGQLQRALQVRIVDRSVEPLDGVDRGEGAGVVADLDRRHRPREQHLGPGVVVQRVGPRSQLVDPRPTLGHPVAHLPEQPEHAEHVRERRDVVGEEPADRDPQVLLLDAQSIGPLDLSFRRPAGVRHELGEVLGVSPGDVGTGVAGGEPLGGELPHRGEHAEARSDRRRRRR